MAPERESAAEPRGKARLAAAAGALAFLAVAGLVGAGLTERADAAALRAVRGPDGALFGGGARWVNAVRDITALGSVVVLSLTVVVGVAVSLAARRRAVAAHLAAVGAGTAALAFGLKALFGRPRPAVVPHLDVVGTASFPSGHALGATAVYLTLGLLAARATPLRRAPIAVAVGLAGAVGVTRCLLGVHYPTDVLAGWAAGAGWAAACWSVAQARAGSAAPGAVE